MSEIWLKISMACLSALLLTSGCGDVDSRSKQALKRFGSSMDGRRIELKLLPVPKNAQINLLTDTSLVWRAKDPNACHVAKTIVYNQEITALVSEIDEVASPELLASGLRDPDAPSGGNPRTEVRLSIVTTFSADGQSIGKQVYTLANAEKSEDISAIEAEKLLTEWHVH